METSFRSLLESSVEDAREDFIKRRQRRSNRHRTRAVLLITGSAFFVASALPQVLALSGYAESAVLAVGTGLFVIGRMLDV